MTDPLPAAKGRNLTMILLIVVYMLNFLDRQILSILKEPIAAELHLNDAQTGWLGGLPFALFFSVLALPAAWLADRGSRVWLMTVALAVWSAFTAACGLSAGFGQLFLARMGVGVGEAGGVPPAYALIADLYPPHSRARAISVYTLGIPLGSAAGILFGGLMAAHVNWRYAFLVIGLVGLVVAPLFRLLVRDPPRGQYDAPVQGAAPGLLATARLVCAKPAFWLMALGAAAASMVGYGFLYWFPTFLARSLNMDITSRSILFSMAFLISGLIGIPLGGWLADRLGQARKGAYPLIPACALLVSAPLYGLAVMAHTPLQAFLLVLIPQALGLVWLAPLLTAVQHLVPVNGRSQASALFLLVNNLIGLSLGPYFFGKVSDLLKPMYGEDSIKWAFVIGLGFYLLAALLLFGASRTLKKAWVD
ncbi:MFS transporter [Asticcacaulis sp. EMRT-3]|uniref:spinster family MFS transporter n=1 Tax=Asticcacaulis sp. EMRT-3 TaxID=3040349 RepID=UPI0024AEF5D9|nr:MFS transporter [Asticcacaulis sp. EMRT-3]MDI7774263.1 MFS transporter [Asticcacaulis sp. EMRT-3]